MIFVALNEAVDRGELFLIDGGICRWHKRRDGVVVIREILVLPRHRKLGKGRLLVKMTQDANPGATIIARCPAMTKDGRVGAANAFWKHMGFSLVGEKGGINEWQRRQS